MKGFSKSADVKNLNLLAIESSAKTASAAVFENNNLLSEVFINTGLTHSETLLPLADRALDEANIKIEDIEKFAVNVGPGSFTGIRIGVSLVKGLAYGKDNSVAPVSTLESIAYNFIDEECIVCACMDARRNQTYTALFECVGGKVNRLREDTAISVEDMIENLNTYSGRIYLAGDGATVFYEKVASAVDVLLPDEKRLYQRASGVGLAAMKNDNFISPDLIVPTYLRLSQAERELKEKQ